jgi:hypothetical protein
MSLGTIYVATYLNPTTQQEAEIRIRQVEAGYRVMAFVSGLRDGDEVTTWEEMTTTEAEARTVALRWRTTLALDFGMQQTASTKTGARRQRPVHEPWGGEGQRWGTDAGVGGDTKKGRTPG